ncbi:MAG: hypothetical protein QOJ89_2584 [bacterium]|jgi:uncharacterized protein (DUF58 family)
MRPALATGLLGVTFALAAALFDAEPLWVAGIALAGIAASNAAWVALAARGVSVKRTLGATRVVEDEPLSIVLEVRGGALALPCARIIDPLLSAPASLRAGRHAGRVRVNARFARRGSHPLGLTSVLISDPLGLATREVRARPSARDDEILVLPRIEPLVSSATGGDAARLARNARRLIGAQAELDGIRPLRDGTPASRIFWPAIARGADPQERYLRAEGDSRPLVVLDPRGADDVAALDAVVRAAASIAYAFARDGGCGVLLPGDRRPTELAHTLTRWPQVHARLALVGPSGAPTLASAASRRGAIIFVSARMRMRLPQAIGSGHGAARVLVVPGAIADRDAAFTVAGCSAYVLGSRSASGRDLAGRQRA